MEKSFKIELNYKDNYSYGMFHCGFCLFDYVYIENLTQAAYNSIKIRITANPDFILSGQIGVDFVAPYGYKALSCDFIKIDPTYLARLQSVENASVQISILDIHDTVLDSAAFSCKLLPYFCFSGMGDKPESLAMFVTPDQEELGEIGPICAYTDSLDLCHQIYQSLKERRITFSSEDFSGSIALPLRLPERVLKERTAAPLELGLLFASLCERNGLAPVLAFAGKNKVYSGFSLREKPMKLLSLYPKGTLNLEHLYFIDCNYFAFGSELPFDQALFHTKNYLSLSDEKITVLDISAARGAGIFPLPKRMNSNLVLSEPDQEAKSGGFSDYYDLICKYSDEAVVSAILTGKSIFGGGQKQAVNYDNDLDVNQNKILGKVLSNPFTLIRAQMGAGASTLFAKASLSALKNGKSVLYITDPSYHTDSFKNICSEYFDSSFILDLTEEKKLFSKADFEGIFDSHDEIFGVNESIKDCLHQMDSYYSDLEGEKKIVSSFLVASDRYHQLQDATDGIVFSPEQVGMLSDEMVQNWFTTVNEIVKVVGEIGSVSDHPLLLVKQKSFSYEYKSKLIRYLEEILHCIEHITLIRDQLVVFFPSLEDLRSYNAFYAFQDLVRLFSEFQVVPESFFANPHSVEEHFKNVTQLIQAKKENESILETLQISFQKEIFELDANDLFSRFNQLKFDKSFKAITQKHSILKSVKRYLKPNCDVENVEYILSRLDVYQKNLALIEQEKGRVFSLLSVRDDHSDSAWDQLQVAADLCYQAYSVFQSAFSLDRLHDFAADFRIASETVGVMDKLCQLRDLSEEYIILKDQLEKLLLNQLDFFYPEASARGSDYFSSLYGKLQSTFASMDHLKSWCGWLLVREDALRIGLKNIVNAVESGKILMDELRKAFLRAFFKAVCEFNFIAHPELVPDHMDFEELTEKFVILSQKQKKLLKKEMNAILSHRRLESFSEIVSEAFDPIDLITSNTSAFTSAFPLVIASLHEAEALFGQSKKMFDFILIENRNRVSLSRLFWTFSAGKKVAFAGALSSSYYTSDSAFDLSTAAFDYFWKHTDEKYSLSAIYSGNSSVNGFCANYSKALRTDCRAYTAPATQFSPDLEWVRVSGSFDTEYENANLAEAEYCIDYLENFILSGDSDRIGVIAGTNEQKKLILRLLAQRLRQKEELALAFRSAEHIRILSVYDSLESCDRVLFCATYSTDRSLHGSRLSYRSLEFGGSDPKKALLSILSCAKKKICVVTSFGMEELRFSPSLLSTNSAFHLLFHLLAAPKGNNSYVENGTVEKSAMISDIRSILEAKGFQVLCGVQSGRYYIDLAVLSDGVFQLGIISDQTVMNQKSNLSSIEIANRIFYEKNGWKIYRIRSANAFDSFESEMESILSVLGANLEQESMI